MADIQELAIAVGYKKQSALQTPLVAADCWALRKTNTSIGQPRFNTETDRNDIGKAGPFATQRFPISLESNEQWDYYLTAENAAMLGVFGIGGAVESAHGSNGGRKYVCTPDTLFTASPAMPSTTFVSAIRQGGSDVFDFALIGMCLEEFTLSLTSTPGRDSVTMRSTWIGSGKYANPSTITIPAITTEHILNSGAISQLVINGEDYLATDTFFEVTFTWKNNIRVNVANYPGSGSQQGYSLRGRMWRGKPEVTMSMKALFENGSPELDAFLNATEGTTTIEMLGDLIGAGPEKYGMKLNLARTVLTSDQDLITETDGLVTVQPNVEVLQHPTNGLLSWESYVTRTGIGTSA